MSVIADRTRTTRPARSDPDRVDDPRRERLRLLACSAFLSVLSLVQQPGVVSPDTKLDLTADPLGFMARALHVWDPIGAFGQLQNQAYGYLFPMGPFFAAGHLAGLPAWLVQRLWLATILLLAFHGCYAVARALRVGTPTTALFAAFVYALSPRMLSAVGGVSVEVWPMAVAPWVLLPLVIGARRGSERRAAAASGLALVLAGGVNAVATLATLPLCAWWLLTRPAGPRRRRLVLWWVPCVSFAVAWWAVPLLVLGRYSPPFLDWIESAAVTTAPTSLADTLRGTTHWIAYLSGARGPLWPAGWFLVSQPMMIAYTVVLAGLGVLGLCRASLPHRRFLVGGVVIGLVLVASAYGGPLGGGLAPTLQSLLDGPIAPFRNLHKFEPVIRLPLALAVAHALADVRLARLKGIPWSRHALLVACAAALVGVSAPAVAGQLPQRGGFSEVPGYWHQAADWLADHQGSGRALVVPGSPFSVSYWGESRDTALQPFARRPWAVREGVPLSSAGNIRTLDAIEARLAAGVGSPGLADFLARAGVSHVVVRNDLDWPVAAAPRPLLVHQTLTRSPGFEEVAFFGPAVGGGRELPTAVVDQARDLPFPAVEIYRVVPFRAPVELVAAGSALSVGGSPEGLLGLADAGLLDRQPSLLQGDPLAAGVEPTRLVVTDSLRRREADFAAVRDNASATMTADEPYLQRRRVHDWEVSGSLAPKTVAEYVGDVRDIRVSSSASFVNGIAARGNEYLPFAALDGRWETAWRSGSARGPVGEWLEVRLAAGQSLSQVDLVFDPQAGADVSEVAVETDGGRVVSPIDAGNVVHTIRPAPGPTERLRVTVTRVSDPGRHRPVALREVAIPGVVVQRTLRVPEGPAGAGASAVVFEAAGGGRDDCAFLGPRPLCAPGLARLGEEEFALDRTFSLGGGGEYLLAGTVRPRPSPFLDRLLLPLGPAIHATASSRAVADPGGRPQAAVDRDIGTGWIADRDDTEPVLTLDWGQTRGVSAVRLLNDPALAASRPAQVRISAVGRSYLSAVDADGWARFPPLAAASLKIEFAGVRRVTSLDPRTGVRTSLPVGVSEVMVSGADDLRRGLDLAASSGLPCGFAPDVILDGRRITTRAIGTVGDVFRLGPLRLAPCEGLRHLAPGEHRVRIDATAESAPARLQLTPAAWPASPVPTAGEPAVTRWDAVARSLQVPPAGHDRLLVVHENFNEGWRARLDGLALRPIRIDGWQQGWIVPAGAAGQAELTYAPDRIYRAGLLSGAALAVVLVLLALVRGHSPRSRHSSASGEFGATARQVRRPMQLALAASALAAWWLVAGWVGVGVLLLVSVLTWWSRGLPSARWRSRSVAVVVLVAALAAVCAAAPWPNPAPGSRSAWSQLLCLGLIALALTTRASESEPSPAE